MEQKKRAFSFLRTGVRKTAAVNERTMQENFLTKESSVGKISEYKPNAMTGKNTKMRVAESCQMV
jgi:hypothetical protein